MRKVLVISYYFPPAGGSGVQRVLKFVKYLPLYGWEPVVLTVKDAEFPARDESLLREIPPHVKIYRTKIFEPYAFYRWITRRSKDIPIDVNVIPQQGAKRPFIDRVAEFFRATRFIPDARIGWFPYALPEGKRILSSERIDVIYSSSPPYTCAVIANALHRISGKPWVAGFRDPWTGFLSTPQRWSFPRAVDTILERSCCTNATAIEAAWQGINKDILRKYPEISREKFQHIPNGFDSEDYPHVEKQRNERFTITYVGSLYGKRNPQVFLQAIRELLHDGAIELHKIRLQFVGRFGQEVNEMLRDKDLVSVIDIVSYVPHSKALELLLQSDTLLLIVDEFVGNEEIVPGKVFEYLGARRPIITIAPNGAVADLIREANSGKSAPSDDLTSLKSIILEYYRNFWYDRIALQPDTERINQFERKQLTKKLASLFDKVSLSG
ncbi:MAG: glycosyltransferase [Bacteroidota bacterium]